MDAIDRDARGFVTGLTAEQGVWRSEPASSSVAHCLDHLATANRVYLSAMEPAAEQALQRGSRRRRPALPGLIGGWFVRTLEPPDPFIRGVRFSLATGLHVIAAHDRRHLWQAWNVRKALGH